MEKKSICLFFQIHQPMRLRNYRFFDIGNEHYYYDDFANRTILQRIARNCYLPMNDLLLNMIDQYGKKFKISLSITGLAMEQFEMYAPEVLDSFKELADTGCVEFLAQTYSHSFISLVDDKEFAAQVKKHSAEIQRRFGVKPKSFNNTEMVYSDTIGAAVARMGYKTMLTECAKHVMGWKSPNFVYTNTEEARLRVLMRNYNLSDDIAFRFSDKSWDGWPLTADKYLSWIDSSIENEDLLNLFMDYETFGEHQSVESGIFNFMESFISQAIKSERYEFLTVAETSAKHQPKATFHSPYAISWADEERDLSAWLGNELQSEAYETLYGFYKELKKLKNPELDKDFTNLQASDHLYYMCTKMFADGGVHSYFTPYSSPYEAYINYMNVLSDFSERINEVKEQNKMMKQKK